MKKLLKVLLVIILIIIILLFTIPLLFKGQLLKLVQDEINKNVNAKVEFADFNLSLIKNFPSLTISLEQLKVEGIEKFDGKTLIAFNSFDIALNLGSVLKKNIEVTKIILDHPVINGIVLEDGTANWDIAKPSEENKEEVTDSSASSEMDYKIALKKFEIIEANINYDDSKSDIKATLGSLNFNLSGNLGLEFTSMLTELDIKEIDVIMGGIRYVKKSHFHFLSDLDADLKNQIFTLKNNELTFNALKLILKGKAAQIGEDLDLDINFETNKSDIKGLLSMVPSIYMKDFEKIETTGKLQLNGAVKGKLTKKQTPSATVSLNVENGMFKYPDLPKSINNLNIAIHVDYNGINNDKTIVDVNRFHFELGENPFDLTLNLKTPISDPQVKSYLKGVVDLSSLASAIPMEKTNLSGIFTTDLEAEGKMSMIKQEKYEDFKALGKIQLTGFKFNSPSVPKPVSIEKMEINFSPRFVNLAKLDAKMGESDFQLNGKLENFIPYALSDGTIKGKLNFTSNYINFNELMPKASEEANTEEESTETKDTSRTDESIEIPTNIDFSLITSINKILYDKLEIEKIKGTIAIKDQEALMNNLTMDILDGDMKMSGKFSTQEKNNPLVDLDLDVNQIDIKKASNSLSIVDSIAPIAKDCHGKISLDLQYKSKLNNEMSPILPSVNGKGRLQSKNIKIENNKTFNGIADALKNDKFRKIGINDVDAAFSIVDGRVHLEPFQTEINNFKTIIGGDHGLDQTLNYKINMELPSKLIGSEVTNALSKYTGSQNISVNALIKGTTLKPNVSLDIKEIAGKALEAAKEDAKKKVKQELDKKKQEVRKKAKEEADKIIKEAETKAEGIRKTAKVAADKIRQEAENAAKKVEKEAGSNPLKKIAAKTAAEKLRQEGNKKASRLEREANEKANKLVSEARKRANELINKY